MVEAQGREIQALRQEVSALKGKDPIPRRARIEPDMGWEYIGLSLDLDAETWLAIKNGAHVTVKSQGYAGDKQRLDPNDPNFVWDLWEFSGGIGHRLRVSLASSYAKECDDDIEEIYDDVLSRGDIEEY
jgi:hypothetical protein